MQFFNDTIREMKLTGPSGVPSVVSVHVNNEKNFSFVEVGRFACWQQHPPPLASAARHAH